MLIGAGRLTHGHKGRSSHDPGRFVSKSFSRYHRIIYSKQAPVQATIQIMNILSVFVSFVILLKCVVASGDTLGVEFRRAVDEENLGG